MDKVIIPVPAYRHPEQTNPTKMGASWTTHEISPDDYPELHKFLNENKSAKEELKRFMFNFQAR